MGREGEACKGKLRLGKGRVRHRTSAEAWERNDRGQGVNHLLIFPLLHLADLHE